MKRDPMETAAALLASSPIFQGAIPQELQAFLLRGGVPLHAFQRGETLCLPGAHNDCLGMLVEGSALGEQRRQQPPCANEHITARRFVWSRYPLWIARLFHHAGDCPLALYGSVFIAGAC